MGSEYILECYLEMNLGKVSLCERGNAFNYMVLYISPKLFVFCLTLKILIQVSHIMDYSQKVLYNERYPWVWHRLEIEISWHPMLKAEQYLGSLSLKMSSTS